MSWTTLPTVGGIEIIGPSGESLALFYYTGGTFTTNEYDRVLAYARTAAAAPDLLDACKEVAVILNSEGPAGRYDGEPWALRLRAAIAKAEGRS